MLLLLIAALAKDAFNCNHKKTSIKLLLFSLSLFREMYFLFICEYALVCSSVHRMCADCQKGVKTPWNWRYRWLSHLPGGLGTELLLLWKAGSTNCWATSLAHLMSMIPMPDSILKLVLVVATYIATVSRNCCTCADYVATSLSKVLRRSRHTQRQEALLKSSSSCR